jgi:hypothetical protein
LTVFEDPVVFELKALQPVMVFSGEPESVAIQVAWVFAETKSNRHSRGRILPE